MLYDNDDEHKGSNADSKSAPQTSSYSPVIYSS